VDHVAIEEGHAGGADLASQVEEIGRPVRQAAAPDCLGLLQVERMAEIARQTPEKPRPAGGILERRCEAR